VWAITRTGYVGGLAVAARDIHPSANRRLRLGGLPSMPPTRHPSYIRAFGK
jgi:hypothetical protein